MKSSISPESDRLKRAVMYSMTVGPRFFEWKMLRLSGPKALLFLQLMIALLTRSVVNVCAISKDFLFVSLVTINSFNSSPQLGDICLLVQGLNKISPFVSFVCVDAVLDVII